MHLIADSLIPENPLLTENTRTLGTSTPRTLFPTQLEKVPLYQLDVQSSKNQKLTHYGHITLLRCT